MSVFVSEEVDALDPGPARFFLIQCSDPQTADDLERFRVWEGNGEKLTISPGTKIERIGPTVLRVSLGFGPLTYSWTV